MRRRAIGARLAAAACLVASGQVPAQEGTVTGVVYVHNAPAEGAVVYLLADEAPPPVPASPVVMDQRRLRFVPAALPVLPGRTVAFRNSDPLLHNIFSPDTLGDAFDLGTYPEGESRSHTFRRPGAHLILCHIHPEMEGYVFVLSTSHHSVTDADGRFTLEDVPPGTHLLHAWHRRAEANRRTITVGPHQLLRLELHLARRGETPRRRQRGE